ncbi:baseplate J/gp47 family protein [Jeotgalibacillus malaysiensis]|uniref:baseplate J/gp47 family protein n=1 Tax=Jeotgalibacillus malaysiensis TaxID=1508404 RepID=UPI00384ACD67
MYEEQTFEMIMERLLEQIPDEIDKREGSVIWMALAPTAAELEQAYVQLKQIENLTFADTAEGEFLERRTRESGVNKNGATIAVIKGEFRDSSGALMDIPINSRFFIDDVYYIAAKRISVGEYELECEEPGSIGNKSSGSLLSLNNISDLSTAKIEGIIIAGADEETDPALYSRFINVVNEPAFGGNVADYKQKINSITGIGGTKVFPTWQGGGTVKCVLIASDFSSPSQELLDQIQGEIDPPGFEGDGIGWAPIGHVVTIEGVADQSLDITTTVSLKDGFTLNMIEASVNELIESYLLSLRESWEEETQLIVRTAQIEARILMVEGVIDVAGTQINGLEENLTLNDNIPVLGTVIINE